MRPSRRALGHFRRSRSRIVLAAPLPGGERRAAASRHPSRVVRPPPSLHGLRERVGASLGDEKKWVRGGEQGGGGGKRVRQHRKRLHRAHAASLSG